MEAVPRLPMLSFDLKVSPECASFGPQLKQYVRDVYHEDPEMYSNEIHSLEGLRVAAVSAVRDVTGCSALKRYYCQLHFLHSRFPMAKGEAAAVSFTWRDIYSNTVCTLADIRFEMVSILYNIGALHSQLGASDSRVTAEGMKLSCTHFQCAAWAFQHLKDTFLQPAGVDLAPDVTQFMYHLCLAQAQECIVEKSMTDNRKATIIAKVAVQIVDYYNLALNTLEQSGCDDSSVSDTVGSKIYKKWKRYVKFKIAYHSCVSLLYQGQQAEEQQKMGERVAFYQAASEKLEEATKLSKGMDNIEAINESLTFTMDVVEGKKKAAKNENEFIYHEVVPDRDLLPSIKGASLVKGIPFNENDPEVSGPDIFARLVPMKSHEASSLYSEEKAKLMRRIGGMIDEKDQELITFMTSLQLDQLNIHSSSNRLPQELVDRCAALSAKPNTIQSLVESMNKLADTYHDVEGMLQDIKELIQREEVREKEYQEVMGKRPPSIVATDLTREGNKYQEAHAKASESNQTLHKAMTLHISNLKVLSLPLDELQKQIPSLSDLDSSSDDDSSVREMRHLVAKVEEMRQQRAMLSTQLRESIFQDDITRQLVTRTGESLDAIFSQELQKHQRCVSLIEQNLAAQDNILKALTEAYAHYADKRKAVTEILRKREATLSALISSYDAYEDLLAKSSKGIEFYRKLETNVNKLLQRVKGTCKVQDEEREQILAKNNKTVPSTQTVSETASESLAPSSGGPKLKYYLQNMKRGGATGVGGYVSGLPSVTAGQTSSSYYNAYSQVPAPVSSPQPSKYHDYSGPSSQLATESASNQQWVPAIRPAPVGSEGTSEHSSSVKLEPNESKAPLPQHAYSYPAPVISIDQSAVLKAPAGYSSTAYPDYSSTQYNYANPPATCPAIQSVPHVHQQQEQLAFTQGHVNTQGYNYGSTSHVQQYGPTGQGPVSNYAAGNIVVAGSPGSYPMDTKPYPTQQTNLYATEVSHQYQAVQPTYQQVGGVVYPSGTNTGCVNVDQKLQDPGVYYATPSSHQGYGVGTLTSVHQGYPTASTYQTPVTLAACSTPSQTYSGIPQPVLPSASSTQSGYAYDITSGTLQYENISQNVQTGFHGQANAQTHQIMWHHQPQESTYGTAVTDASAALNSAPYYGSEFDPSTSAISLPGGSSSEVSLSNQQYYGSIQQKYQQFQHPYSYPGASNGYSLQQTAEIQPNINADASSSEFQYMAATGASCYTNAGSYITSQTCSSQTSVDGHTFATQYSENQGISDCETPVYSQASYYSLPYGYQYDAEAAADEPESPIHVQQSSYASSTVMNQTPQSPMTYMQARGQNNSTTTTYSQQGGSSVSSSSVQAVKCDESENMSLSNVDLLAGLDFSLNQAPLVPQQPVPEKDEVHTKSVNSNTELVTSPPSSKNVPTAAAVTKTDLSSEVSTLVRDRTVPTLPKTDGPQVEEYNNQQILVSKLTLPKTDTSQEEVKLTPKAFGKDPYTDPDALNQFVQEVGKYEKFVDGLTTKTLNGPTPLDMKWKELLELQEIDAHKRSISVARCYPMKNRFSDILPYDHSRIELPSTKDDYINASYIKNLTPLTPPFIVTQAPLPSTYTDFWTMVWEQQVEVIVCLLNDLELEGQIYWPLEKGQELAMGKMKLTLQSSNTRSHWIERIVSVCANESRTTRVIVHLQFTAWPGSSFPASPGPFLSFVSETLNFYSQQRNACHPVVVHCLSGVGRTGLFCLVTAAVCDIQAGRGLLDLVMTTACMSTHRKGSLRDREHLKFAYQAVLYYAQDLLMKRGILTSRSTFDDKRSRGGKSHTRHPSEDFLLGPPTDLSHLQSGIEKMGLVAANSNSNSSDLKHGGAVQYEATGNRQSSSSSSSGRSTSSSIVGSRSSSPSSCPSGLMVDPTQFSLSTEVMTFRPSKRFTKESFTSKTKGTSLKLTRENPDDPLSQLDPLWPLKRH
ncbi:Tyrosine-protein phosphatase non-receptor type 23 [Zootermopsis nevadensis]|uniref:Tyrosine-protein phosphatase non-receptor type 23 n=1 Tax=Zootermopsis nevadensis TaxID=136037 RepID=A0A067RL56_ZOONE|nr:Tyrosine-protein phosphatase non-receptor type 23 [Zootermopsis nevadensis]